MSRRASLLLLGTCFGCASGAPATDAPTKAPLPSAAAVARSAAPPSQPAPLADGGPVVLTLVGREGVWLGVPDGPAYTGNYATSLSDVWGVGRLVLAAGDHVLRSANGGATWTAHELPGGQRGTKLWGASERDVYLAGATGLSHSSDTGLTWTQLDIGVSTYLLSVWGSSKSDVWAVGGSGDHVLRSADQGRSWTELDVGEHSVRDVWGRAADDVYVAGSRDIGPGFGDREGVLLRSRDHGASWTTLPVAACASVNRIGGTERLLYVACARGVVARSADDGASWEIIGNPGGAELLDLEVLAAGRLVVVGRNQTYGFTDDDGRTWQRETPLGDDLSALQGWWQDGRGTSFIAATGTSGSGGWLLRRMPAPR